MFQKVGNLLFGKSWGISVGFLVPFLMTLSPFLFLSSKGAGTLS